MDRNSIYLFILLAGDRGFARPRSLYPRCNELLAREKKMKFVKSELEKEHETPEFLKYIRDLFDYDLEEGVFYYKRSPAQCIKIGQVAGGNDCTHGYHRIKINGRLWKRSRLAIFYVTGKFPNGVVDHKNLKRHDDRYSNLRIVSFNQNLYNKSLYSNNSSNFKGVYYRKSTDKWISQIQVNGKRIHLGVFGELEEAARAYDLAAIKYFGDFANTNFPIENYEVAK